MDEIANVSEWQPIDTAPNGGIIIVTDGSVFGAAKRWSYAEPAIIGYDPRKFGMQTSIFPNTERPNPRAGEVRWFWLAVAGWSAWNEDAEWEEGEYERASPKMLAAESVTHWMPLPEPPKEQPRRDTYVFVLSKRELDSNSPEQLGNLILAMAKQHEAGWCHSAEPPKEQP